LGHLGAYIVNVPSPEWEEEAISRLDDDYDILENIPLTMPTPLSRNEIQPTPHARQTSAWRDQSGIALAHAKGISGYGVIVGVLDTGCDGDHDEFVERDPIEFILRCLAR
jgi:subtilisin family serine protease